MSVACITNLAASVVTLNEPKQLQNVDSTFVTDESSEQHCTVRQWFRLHEA